MYKENKIVNFNFTYIPINKKQKKVNHIFNSIANKYDLMNDIMSFGIHRIWKRYVIYKSNVNIGDIVLDIASGTGDLAIKFSKMVGPKGKVILSDINYSMLKLGKKKLINNGCINNVEYIQANAELLPFINNSFDCIAISFGLRNIPNKDKALLSMYQVLKPGGRLLILEFSKPIKQFISKIYNKYIFKVLPFLGQIFAKNSTSYKYLAESIIKHPNQKKLKKMLYNAGFDNVEYKNITKGIVALHIGYKY